MRIRVLLFGQLKDIVGKPEETLDLAPGASLSDVVADYGHRFAQFQPLAGSIACALNQEYAPASALLKDGDEVGLLPPVSGGAQAESEAQPELKSPHCAIVQERIATPQIADSLKAPEDGATVIFEGIVRNNTRGRRTLYLHYEAYKPMAVNEMEKLAQQALEQFKIRDVRLVHRLGRLEIGETSVLIVVSSAHRGAAFDACRWIIDTLKKTVPSGKRSILQTARSGQTASRFPKTFTNQRTLAPQLHLIDPENLLIHVLSTVADAVRRPIIFSLDAASRRHRTGSCPW